LTSLFGNDAEGFYPTLFRRPPRSVLSLARKPGRSRGFLRPRTTVPLCPSNLPAIAAGYYDDATMNATIAICDVRLA